MFCKRCKHTACHSVFECKASPAQCSWRKLRDFVLANSQELLPFYLPNDVVNCITTIIFSAFGKVSALLPYIPEEESEDVNRYNPREWENEVTVQKDKTGSLSLATWTQLINWETSLECDGTNAAIFLPP